MRKALIALCTLGTLGIVGCGTANTSTSTTNTVPANDQTVVAQPSTTASDALTYSNEMNPLLDQFAQANKSYNTFLSRYNHHQYSSDDIITQLGNIDLQLEQIQLSNAALNVPSDMQVLNSEFMQSLSDFQSSNQSMENYPMDSLSGSGKTDISKANVLKKESNQEFTQFVHDLESALKS